VNLPEGVPRRAFGWQPPTRAVSAAELAGQLLATAEFRALGLGSWLGTPDGEFFTAAVEAVSPPFYRQDEELLVEALKLAAKMQSGNQKAARALGLWRDRSRRVSALARLTHSLPIRSAS